LPGGRRGDSQGCGTGGGEVADFGADGRAEGGVAGCVDCGAADGECCAGIEIW
jgi:hypothetical protein